jgi:hypothetical protein
MQHHVLCHVRACTCPRHRYMEGALLAGQRAADEVTAALTLASSSLPPPYYTTHPTGDAAVPAGSDCVQYSEEVLGRFRGAGAPKGRALGASAGPSTWQRGWRATAGWTAVALAVAAVGWGLARGSTRGKVRLAQWRW